jgi:ankyrin repeat protein
MPVTPEQEDYLYLRESLRNGDLDGVRLALGDPADFADASDAYTNVNLLEHAIVESDVGFIRRLLELGADPNYEALGGFPSLINTLGGSSEKKYALLELLIAFGADVNQRGVNDYTPLHMAASLDDDRAIAILLAHGADRDARTRVDDFTTAMEEAQRAGAERAIAALRR